MNYVWEAALLADREGIPRERLRFIPVENGSPYTEISLENMNSKSLESLNVEVNPLYRFSRIFAAVFDRNLEGHEQIRRLLFDIFMQDMVRLDLRQGLSRQEYRLRFLLKDLLNGVCGSQAAEVVQGFEGERLHHLLRLILKLYQCGSSFYLLREVMRYLYPDSLVYANNEVVRQVLIYIGVKETEEEKARIRFLMDLFLPVNYQVYLFWDHHFGIIDVEGTMELEELVLF